jgi:RNA polymerase sigma factor (sigma-70 family)
MAVRMMLASTLRTMAARATQAMRAKTEAPVISPELDPQKAQLVDLRYFAGLSIPEAAEVLGVSTATVTREWAVARAWLRRELDA